MRFQRCLLFAVLPFFLAGTKGSSQNQPPSAPATQPASLTSPAPSAGPGESATAAKAKPAKVWTNDDVSALRSGNGVSVVGNRASQGANRASKGHAQEIDPAWYRRQLQQLQGEIANLDAQIEKTKAFLNGTIINDQPASYGAYFGVPGNPQDQLRQMEARREKDQAKVDDLLDRARHNGMEPGDLR